MIDPQDRPESTEEADEASTSTTPPSTTPDPLTPTKFACNICPRWFFRPDHLKRHVQTHIQEKHEKCSYCDKTFSRKDAALRHEQLHTRTPLSDGVVDAASPVTIRQSCIACAQGHIRCSGGLPCEHCSTRGLECAYRPRKRKRLTYGYLGEREPGTPGLDFQGSPTLFADGSTDQLYAAVSPNVQIVNGTRSTWPNTEQTPLTFPGVILPPQTRQTPISTNWLPFVHSDFEPGDLGSYHTDNPVAITDGQHVSRLDQAVLEAAQAEQQSAVAGQIEGSTLADLDNAFFFRQDQVSALIKYMQHGPLVAAGPPNGGAHTDADHALTPTNRLYADGAGFRESQAERSIFERRAAFVGHNQSHDEQQPGLSWTALLLEKIRLDQTRTPRLEFEISEQIFHEMHLTLCQPSGRPLLSPESLANQNVLLRRDTLNYFIQLYFQYFHPVYPFLERSLLSIPVWGWSLCLATAAIGSTLVNGGVGALLAEESTRSCVSQAADTLWTNLTASTGTTRFSTVIIIHVLLRRKWNVSQYLDELIPSRSPSTTQTAFQLPLTTPRDRYLGAISEYSKWRNYTCDCLDVLHWEALSLSARAGGLESPVFLHLHLSRLLILVPTRELLEHAHTHMMRDDTTNNLLPHNLYQLPRPGPRWRQTILTWAHQDRYKARLAVIHAGSVFWHVRRYASYSFIEPFTIFLAALVLLLNPKNNSNTS
ncbi:hypothetical protein N0V88_006290 [Collariella sp. IMI 366227]|nr:hypothetical protein N0V88_006290 [Collariella sp. IMI 366227]